MDPGLMQFTCTPSAIPSSARALVNESIAALTDPPMANSAPGVRPPAPETKSNDPLDAFKYGHAARDTRIEPKYFNANPSAKSASVNSRKLPRLVAPALLTAMSKVP